MILVQILVRCLQVKNIARYTVGVEVSIVHKPRNLQFLGMTTLRRYARQQSQHIQKPLDQMQSSLVVANVHA